MVTSFLSSSELDAIGLNDYGINLQLSRFARIYAPESITIGDNVRIDDFCVLSGGSGITLGNHVHIGCYSSIFGSGTVRIEDFANISSRVAIYSESDDSSGLTMTNPTIPRRLKTNQIIAPVVCMEHSVVFTNSTILPGVVLKEGAVLGAHSLAKNDLQPWSIYAGVPARLIRKREKQLLSQVPSIGIE